MAKNIFIAATGKDAGKSTLSFALLEKMTKMNLKVGFMKPVGQRWLDSKWGKVEEDVILMKEIFRFNEMPSDMNPIVIKQGFTEEYLSKMIKPDLASHILEGYNKVSRNKDYVIIEGTGHAGVGSVIDQSNADVAKLLHSKVILVGKGGIGSAIDILELNRKFFENQGVEVIGIILNKVHSDKMDKVKLNVRKYCKAKNLKFLGCIPYSPILSNPTLGQVIDELKPEVIFESDARKVVIDDFIVGASNVEEFLEIMQEKSGNILMVFPSSRLDIILAVSKLLQITKKEVHILGVLFSGKTKPSRLAIDILKGEGISVLWKNGDTYSVISKMSSISIKTGPEEDKKIDEIKKIVIANIQYSNILNSLHDVNLDNQFLKKARSMFMKIFQIFQGRYQKVRIRKLKQKN
ncbi:MAG: AAA family ATPase [Candidatus Marinimicrobia bacterium]|nr:AAA family ATPase [Candidatus Neomarinimicrobiota bacterium]